MSFHILNLYFAYESKRYLSIRVWLTSVVWRSPTLSISPQVTQFHSLFFICVSVCVSLCVPLCVCVLTCSHTCTHTHVCIWRSTLGIIPQNPLTFYCFTKQSLTGTCAYQLVQASRSVSPSVPSASASCVGITNV